MFSTTAKSALIGTTLLSLLASLVPSAEAHALIVAVHGSNGKTGVGYGVNVNGRFPRKPGQPGDAGADASVFDPPSNPNPPCGKTGWAGAVDPNAELMQAEGFGLPAAFPNGSVVATVFQVNRDGGGPMMCEYSADAKLTNWQQMTMDLNMAGEAGIDTQDRVNETIVATFPQGAKCTGGNHGTACVVRCRTGVNVKNNQQYRFGSCFAVQLASGGGSSPAPTNGERQAPNTPTAGSSSQTCSCNQLSKPDLDTVAAKVVAQLKQQGYVVKNSPQYSSPAPQQPSRKRTTKKVAHGHKKGGAKHHGGHEHKSHGH